MSLILGGKVFSMTKFSVIITIRIMKIKGK